MSAPLPPTLEVSERMRTIRVSGTAPELMVRKIARQMGLKYRGNVRDLPGKPDLVLTDFAIVVFVDGCYWHGCPKCFTAPKHNRQWWLDKIATTKRRDKRMDRRLRTAGFKVVHLWEHDKRERIVKRITWAVTTTTG